MREGSGGRQRKRGNASEGGEREGEKRREG
jgi:hypothetical protein